MLSRDYAQGLYELGGKPEHLKPLKSVLERRGHLKLLPQILAEYQKLEEHDARIAKHKEETPEQAQTRQLLELYRTLTV
ncbi:MAG: hypothetical protein KA066_00120 [Candidatus Pacebacteria bacterium]|nr:hypothetical protein [Candidatus Paceibacterota bacterium]